MDLLIRQNRLWRGWSPIIERDRFMAPTHIQFCRSPSICRVTAPDGACQACLLTLGLASALARESSVSLTSSAAPADLIGRCKLLELIGEGGFDSVWMAEQQGSAGSTFPVPGDEHISARR